MRTNECQCGCGGESNECMNKEQSNYMFFGNLKTMKRLIDELIQMDPAKVDSILNDGHAWAVDHIASSADDIQEVYNFLKNGTDSKQGNDAFSEDTIFVKAFESFILESSENSRISIREIKLKLEKEIKKIVDTSKLSKDDINTIVDKYQTGASEWMKIPEKEIPVVKRYLINKHIK
jgi:hypothetical protein